MLHQSICTTEASTGARSHKIRDTHLGFAFVDISRQPQRQRQTQRSRRRRTHFARRRQFSFKRQAAGQHAMIATRAGWDDCLSVCPVYPSIHLSCPRPCVRGRLLTAGVLLLVQIKLDYRAAVYDCS